MTTLATDRTTANTPAEHVTDHNVLHTLNNAGPYVALAGDQTITGTKTFTKKLLVQHPVAEAGGLAVDFQADNGLGLKSRFIIENNVEPGPVDINFRDCSLEFGSYSAAVSGACTTRFYQPTGSTGNHLVIYPPGRDPAVNANAAFYVGPNGSVVIACGGLASQALVVKTGGDANSKFEVSETGVHSWGAGGGTAIDTNLYRSAADTLKTDDALHVAAAFRHLGSTLGFYNATATTKPTGVAVTAGGIHAALVTLGLIAA